jgi:hypothetical protein
MTGALVLPGFPVMQILFALCPLCVDEPLDAKLRRDDALLTEWESPPVTALAARGTVFSVTFEAVSA